MVNWSSLACILSLVWVGLAMWKVWSDKLQQQLEGIAYLLLAILLMMIGLATRGG